MCVCVFLHRPGQAQPALDSAENHIYEETTDYGLEHEPEEKNALFEASNSDSNPYSKRSLFAQSPS